MTLFDTTGAIYLIIEAITNNITGSIFLTLLFIMLLIIASLLIFGVPPELSIILIAPLILVVMSYMGEFLAVGGIMLIWLAIIFGRRFFIR